MKVRVSFTVEIDPAAWTSNYGVEGAAAHRARRAELVESGDVEDSGQRATKPNGRKAILWTSAR
jgi:hypothetical protein